VDTFLKEPVKSGVKEHGIVFDSGSSKSVVDLHAASDGDPDLEAPPEGEWFAPKKGKAKEKENDKGAKKANDKGKGKGKKDTFDSLFDDDDDLIKELDKEEGSKGTGKVKRFKASDASAFL